MAVELPTGDYILICPKGDRYSMVSDADFAKMNDLSLSLLKLEEVETDVWAAWMYNAKTIHYLQEYSSGGASVEGEYHRAAYIAGEEDLVFATDYTFPTAKVDDSQSFYRDEKGILFEDTQFSGVTEAGLVAAYGDQLINRYYTEEEAPMPHFGRLFYHQEKWYLGYLVGDQDDANLTHTVTASTTALVITSTRTFPLDPETDDATTTTTWTITEAFH